MRKDSVKKALEALQKAEYAIETVVLVRLADGAPGAILGLPDEPQIADGKTLAEHGLDLYKLIKDEYIYPISNQHIVEKALEVIEKWRDYEQRKSSQRAPRHSRQRTLEVIR